MNHKTMFQALVEGVELTNKHNGKVLKLDDNGNAILMCKNWHNFDPKDWVINNPEDLKNSETESKD